MSHTNGFILSELRGIGITPSKAQCYELDVQCWLWSYLGDLSIWNLNPHCHCHDSWVEETDECYKNKVRYHEASGYLVKPRALYVAKAIYFE